jgi:hypothetical protein
MSVVSETINHVYLDGDLLSGTQKVTWAGVPHTHVIGGWQAKFEALPVLLLPHT